MYADFDLEQRIILIASRTKETVDFNELKNVLENNLNWERIILLASKNKVLYLIYENITSLGLKRYLPKQYHNLMDDSCYCNNIRNTEKLNELAMIIEEMNAANIDILPVKGGYLIDNVYKSRSARVTNDMDALIKKKDIKVIDNIMRNLGYVNGYVDNDKKELKSFSQTKKVLYKTKMYNLLPYVKFGNMIPNCNLIFDFSFALDFSLNVLPVEEMINNSKLVNNKKQLLPEHFFVHMCCHHYREASNIEWIKIGKDLTLMKFCDVRSFILQEMNESSLKNALEFAVKYDLTKAVYFTIYFLKEIYGDGYEQDLLDRLSIKDDSFLYMFSEDGSSKLTATRKKDFWASLFSIDNKDEITKMSPQYEVLL